MKDHDEEMLVMQTHQNRLLPAGCPPWHCIVSTYPETRPMPPHDSSSWPILAIQLDYPGHPAGLSWPSSWPILAIQLALSWPSSWPILAIQLANTPQMNHVVLLPRNSPERLRRGEKVETNGWQEKENWNSLPREVGQMFQLIKLISSRFTVTLGRRFAIFQHL